MRIEFLISGDYPGDGKPKPVAFPHPDHVAIDIDGIQFLSLHSLIELKLASGITNPRRGKDLVDVQELIDHLKLRRHSQRSSIHSCGKNTASSGGSSETTPHKQRGRY